MCGSFPHVICVMWEYPVISTIVFKLLSCGPAIISPNFLHRLCIWGGYFCASFCTSMDTVSRVLFCFQINQNLVLFEIWMIPCCPGILTSEPSHPPASVSLALGSHVCNSTDTEPQKGRAVYLTRQFLAWSIYIRRHEYITERLSPFENWKFGRFLGLGAVVWERCIILDLREIVGCSAAS